MKQSYAAALVLLTACVLLVLPALAGEEEERRQKEMEEMMRAEAEAGRLGPQHEGLAFFLGAWDVKSRFTMPGMPDTPSPGTATFTWLYEGRWLQHRFDGAIGGMSMKSFGIAGFDSYRKKYVLTFVDDKSTRMTRAEGVVVDPSGKTTVLYGEMDEPSMGIADKAFKIVKRVTGEDSYVQEIWDLGIGPDGMKVVEMNFTRRK